MKKQIVGPDFFIKMRRLCKIFNTAGVLSFLLILFTWHDQVQAATHNVSTTADLVTALALAATNSEDDNIHIAAGVYKPTDTLIYDSHEDFSLSLTGEGATTILDGSSSNHRILLLRTYTSAANIIINNLTIQNGYSPEGNSGAGMLVNVSSSDVTVVNTIIKDCFAAAFYFSNHGGGAYITGGLGANITISNCIIAGNHAKGYGGGLYLNITDGTLNFINNTVVDNNNSSSVVEQGGGVYLKLYDDNAIANIHNTIFWGNTFAYGNGDIFIENDGDENGGFSQVTLSHNDYGTLNYASSLNLSLTENISETPLLDNNYHLRQASACIDHGNNGAPSLQLTDIDGNERIIDGDCSGAALVDIGADEYYDPVKIETTAASSITSTSAVSGGTIVSEGCYPITARGLCFSDEPSPDTNDTCTTDGSGLGIFSSSLSGLNNHTTYYLRAYGEDFLGTTYGSEISFTTSELPTVTTAEITNINAPSAVSGGNVSSAGDAAVSARGVCWSTTPIPDLHTATCSTDGEGTGLFSSNLFDLVNGQIYWVRAYGTNSKGTSYGQERQFLARNSWILFLPAILAK